MTDISPTVIKKLQTLARMAEELRAGKDFNITRLTMLKSFCDDPEATAAFALDIARKTQRRMKIRSRTINITPKKWQQFQRLAARGVRAMAAYLKNPTDQADERLGDLLLEIRSVQDRYEDQRWGAVRIVESMELLVVETAMECLFHPWTSSDFGYRLVRQYAERYNPRYGNGLVPESAPLVDDIAEFWGRHFLGRSWRKRVEK